MIRSSVKIDGRRFIVESSNGAPRRIVERKLINGSLRNASYWYPQHHRSHGPNTIVQRILKEVL
jgi:hypothetical protein